MLCSDQIGSNTVKKIAPQVLMPRGIHAVTCSYLLANCIGIINNAMLSAVAANKLLFTEYAMC